MVKSVNPAHCAGNVDLQVREWEDGYDHPQYEIMHTMSVAEAKKFETELQKAIAYAEAYRVQTEHDHLTELIKKRDELDAEIKRLQR